MKFIDTMTYKNLNKALKGELLANFKYTLYANKAKRDGYEQIRDIFLSTAGNEFEHAELFYEKLNKEVKDTKENLFDASRGENNEWTIIYKEYAETALKEGYSEISELFSNIANIELHHEERFLKLLRNIEEGKVFEKDNMIFWICLNCGYVHYSIEAPMKCPVCGFPRSYFMEKTDNY